MFPEEIVFVLFIFAVLVGLALVGLVIAFWIWMLVDSIKRDFRNDGEKVAWVLVIVFLGLPGALLYFFIIKVYHQAGLSKG